MKLSILLVTVASVLVKESYGFAFTNVGRSPASIASTQLRMTAEERDVPQVVKVGVIGCGRIGLVHLEAITKAPGVVPVIVSNPTVSKAEAGKKNVERCSL